MPPDPQDRSRKCKKDFVYDAEAVSDGTKTGSAPIQTKPRNNKPGQQPKPLQHRISKSQAVLQERMHTIKQNLASSQLRNVAAAFRIVFPEKEYFKNELAKIKEKEAEDEKEKQAKARQAMLQFKTQNIQNNVEEEEELKLRSNNEPKTLPSKHSKSTKAATKASEAQVVKTKEVQKKSSIKAQNIHNDEEEEEEDLWIDVSQKTTARPTEQGEQSTSSAAISSGSSHHNDSDEEDLKLESKPETLPSKHPKSTKGATKASKGKVVKTKAVRKTSPIKAQNIHNNEEEEEEDLFIDVSRKATARPIMQGEQSTSSAAISSGSSHHNDLDEEDLKLASNNEPRTLPKSTVAPKASNAQAVKTKTVQNKSPIKARNIHNDEEEEEEDLSLSLPKTPKIEQPKSLKASRAKSTAQISITGNLSLKNLVSHDPPTAPADVPKIEDAKDSQTMSISGELDFLDSDAISDSFDLETIFAQLPSPTISDSTDPISSPVHPGVLNPTKKNSNVDGKSEKAKTSVVEKNSKSSVRNASVPLPSSQENYFMDDHKDDLPSTPKSLISESTAQPPLALEIVPPAPVGSGSTEPVKPVEPELKIARAVSDRSGSTKPPLDLNTDGQNKLEGLLSPSLKEPTKLEIPSPQTAPDMMSKVKQTSTKPPSTKPDVKNSSVGAPSPKKLSQMPVVPDSSDCLVSLPKESSTSSKERVFNANPNDSKTEGDSSIPSTPSQKDLSLDDELQSAADAIKSQSTSPVLPIIDSNADFPQAMEIAPPVFEDEGQAGDDAYKPVSPLQAPSILEIIHQIPQEIALPVFVESGSTEPPFEISPPTQNDLHTGHQNKLEAPLSPCPLESPNTDLEASLEISTPQTVPVEMSEMEQGSTEPSSPEPDAKRISGDASLANNLLLKSVESAQEILPSAPVGSGSTESALQTSPVTKNILKTEGQNELEGPLFPSVQELSKIVLDVETSMEILNPQIAPDATSKIEQAAFSPSSSAPTELDVMSSSAAATLANNLTLKPVEPTVELAPTVSVGVTQNELNTEHQNNLETSSSTKEAALKVPTSPSAPDVTKVEQAAFPPPSPISVVSDSETVEPSTSSSRGKTTRNRKNRQAQSSSSVQPAQLKEAVASIDNAQVAAGRSKRSRRHTVDQHSNGSRGSRSDEVEYFYEDRGVCVPTGLGRTPFSFGGKLPIPSEENPMVAKSQMNVEEESEDSSGDSNKDSSEENKKVQKGVETKAPKIGSDFQVNVGGFVKLSDLARIMEKDRDEKMYSEANPKFKAQMDLKDSDQFYANVKSYLHAVNLQFGGRITHDVALYTLMKNGYSVQRALEVIDRKLSTAPQELKPLSKHQKREIMALVKKEQASKDALEKKKMEMEKQGEKPKKEEEDFIEKKDLIMSTRTIQETHLPNYHLGEVREVTVRAKIENLRDVKHVLCHCQFLKKLANNEKEPGDGYQHYMKPFVSRLDCTNCTRDYRPLRDGDVELLCHICEAYSRVTNGETRPIENIVFTDSERAFLEHWKLMNSEGGNKTKEEVEKSWMNKKEKNWRRLILSKEEEELIRIARIAPDGSGYATELKPYDIPRHRVCKCSEKSAKDFKQIDADPDAPTSSAPRKGTKRGSVGSSKSAKKAKTK